MKILVIGDLHGKKPKIHFNDFDCIVQIGDVCDDSKIGPLYKKYFQALKDNPDTDLEADKFFIKRVGKKKFKEYEKKSLEKGYEILKQLDKYEKPIFMVAGNWDQSYGTSKIKDLNKSDYHYIKSFLDWFLGDRINQKKIFEKAKLYDPNDKTRCIGATVPSVMLSLKNEGYKMIAWHERL